MAIVNNSGFNNPQLGQAFSDLASLFGPPSSQDIAVNQQVKVSNAKMASDAAAAAARQTLSDKLRDGSATFADWYAGTQDNDPVKFGKYLQQRTALANPNNLSAQDPLNYANTGTIAGTVAAERAKPMSENTVSYEPASLTGAAGPTTRYGIIKNGDRSTLLPNGQMPQGVGDSVWADYAKAVGLDLGPYGVASVSAPEKPATLAQKDAENYDLLTPEQKRQRLLNNGGTNVSVSTEKGILGNIGSKIDTSFDKAKGSVQALPVLDRQEDALNKGMITGGGADIKIRARNLLSGILGIRDPGLEHTQEYISAAQNNVASNARALSNQGHTTNMDIDVGRMLSGADPNYTEAALREVIRQQRLFHQDNIAQHNALVDKFQNISPDTAKAADFYRITAPQSAFPAATRVPPGGTTQTPAAKPPSTTTDPLAAARAAINGGADRGAVIQRLRQNGIDPTGL